MSTPPRLSDDCYQGLGRYFVTICTENRENCFTSVAAFDHAHGELLRTLRGYRFEGIAYCFMRDHFHGLFEATADDCNLKKFAAMFKQRSSFARKQATGRRLWQEGYFDRVLRSDEATLDVIEYIVNNPVRAGYCTDAREYPFTGSTVYTIDQLCEAVGLRPRNRWRP